MYQQSFGVSEKQQTFKTSPFTGWHTYASMAFLKGADVKFISMQLGHKSVKTTYDIYIDFIKEKNQIEINKVAESDTYLDIELDEETISAW